MIGYKKMINLIHASYEGIRLISLDRRDKGSVTSLQKYKTLQSRLFGSCKRSEQAEGDSEGRMSDHGVRIKLRVGGGTGTSGISKVEIFLWLARRLWDTTSGTCVRGESKFVKRAWTKESLGSRQG